MDNNYMESVIVAFLQQAVKENPTGVSIRDFERDMPVKSDEPQDWYKRAGYRTALDAVKAIESDAFVVEFSQRLQSPILRLNMASDKIDMDLVDLIQGQKTSSKKRRAPLRPSSRAETSFSLNRQYSNNWQVKQSSYRLNSENRRHIFSDSATRYSSDKNKGSTHDPRTSGGNKSYNSMVPPQVQYSSYNHSQRTSSSYQQSSQPSRNNSSQWPTQPAPKPPAANRSSSPDLQRSNRFSRVTPPPSNQTNYAPEATSNSQSRSRSFTQISDKPIKRRESVISRETALTEKQRDEDPELLAKKSHLRQKLMFLLSNRNSEIKLIHLPRLYEMEFQEQIDPKLYGHKSLTNLINDPLIKQFILISYSSAIVSIQIRPAAKSKYSSDDKENSDIRKQTASEAKLDAIEPFNLKSMANTLEPLAQFDRPILQHLPIDDAVKFKTIQIIYKYPNHSLPIESWQAKFEALTRLKIRIADYGFHSLLDFFYHLSKELPLRVILKNDEWFAILNQGGLQAWIDDQLDQGKYKAICAFESRYEHIAYPDEKFIQPDQQSKGESRSNPAEQLVIIEERMNCFRDYHEKNLLSLPPKFIKAGLPCAAFDKTQQRWCRALVVKTPEIVDRNCDVDVELVDYGIKKEVPIAELSGLLKNLMKIPIVISATTRSTQSR